MKGKNKMNNFKTTDITLASTLYYFSFVIDSIEKQNSNKCVFYFARKDGLDDTIQAYWAGKLQIEPKRFFACLKEIKTRLYERY